MKRILIFSALSMFMAGVNAQQKKDTVIVVTRDTTSDNKKSIVIRLGSTDSRSDTIAVPLKAKDKFKLHFTATRFDFGISTYLDKGSFTLSPENSFLERETAKSTNFGFDFLQMGYRFNKYFKIYTGAGLDWNHMRLKQNITIQKSKPTLTYVTESVEYKKNRFSSQYLRIPLAFQFRSNAYKKGNHMHFVFGPEVGFLLNGKVKQISKENGKEKFKDDYNLNPFRYGAVARLGYGGTGIYVKYYGNDVFAEGQGPSDFKNLSFGITLGL
ncbi:outer membrane beta-barrel protein [Daejeonella sp.]|jgi:opacity protein-like surface antigen|uniref:outer membrane beta-barrel protein n=1 Tax=Daejeonella sp. TaxID=2805397 RepID=UPI003785084F